jgi:hypothetical protein
MSFYEGIRRLHHQPALFRATNLQNGIGSVDSHRLLQEGGARRPSYSDIVRHPASTTTGPLIAPNDFYRQWVAVKPLLPIEDLRSYGRQQPARQQNAPEQRRQPANNGRQQPHPRQPVVQRPDVRQQPAGLQDTDQQARQPSNNGNNDRTGPALPKDPAAAKRVDLLSNVLFRYVQLRHHMRNWIHVPDSIKAAVDSILHTITPPRIDDTFRFDLANIGKQFIGSIVDATRQHIADHLKTALDGLEYQSAEELQLAIRIADRHLEQRLNRLPATDRREYLSAGKSLCTLVAASSSTSAPAFPAVATAPSTTDWQFQKPKHHRRVHHQHDTPASRSVSPTKMDTGSASPPAPVTAAATASSTIEPVQVVPAITQPAPATSSSPAVCDDLITLDDASDTAAIAAAFPATTASTIEPVVAPISSTTVPVPTTTCLNNDTAATAVALPATTTSTIEPVVASTSSAAVPVPTTTCLNTVDVTPANRKRKASTSDRASSALLFDDVISIASDSPATDKRVDLRLSPTLLPADRDRVAALYDHTAAGVHVFRGNKDEWSLAGLATKDFVVIADSNFRQAASVPASLEIFCLPGARLRHVTEALRSFIPTLRDSKVNVILQVGINNRDDSSVELDDSIDQLQDIVYHHPYIADFYFIGVSYPHSLDAAQKERIDQLNDAMLLYVTPDFFVHPLPETEVVIAANDRWGIHHTPGTVEKILLKTCDTIALRQDFL